MEKKIKQSKANHWKIYLSVLFISLLTALPIYAQTITGTVVAFEDNEPLPGVNVIVKGTNNGTITDVNGKFNVSAGSEDTLQFTYIGMLQEEVRVGNQSKIDVQMMPNIEELEEVVVVGYGNLKKTEVIGSVASVKGEDLEKVKAPNFTEALQGRAAGLRIGTTSGVPGANVNIKIRGDNSINTGTDPLWIVDGMPVFSGSGLEGDAGRGTRQDPMSMINPNDIASIEILKDAAATAIYGSRGSNGVIIITTKSGKQGVSNTNVSVTAGLTELIRTPEQVGFTNTQQWFDLVEQGRENSGLEDRNFSPTPVLGTFRDNPVRFLSRDEALQVNTNWFDEILRTGSFQEYNISNTQGSENFQSFMSLNYRHDESVLENNSLTRITGRVNLDFNATENIKLGTKLTFSNTQNDRVASGSGANGGGFLQANREALPWFPIYDPSHPSGYWNPRSRMNLVAMNDSDLYSNTVENYRGLGGVYAEVKIPFIEGLKARSEFSFDLIQNNRLIWRSHLIRVNEEDGTTAQDQATTEKRINYNLYLTYDRDFGDHSINVVGGTETQANRRNIRRINALGVTSVFQDLGSGSRPAEVIQDGHSFLSNELYLRAYFSRLNYVFKERYLFGFSMRYDGVSKFLGENRWALFPAVSAGWIISDENFMAPLTNVINLLKFRGSYGVTGNQNVNNNAFVTTYRNNSGDRYGELNNIVGGTNIVRIGDPNITWETTDSYDIGVDFGLFNNRISGYFTYYYQFVDGLLIQSRIPPSSGTNNKNIWENIGELENQGVELQLSGTAINTPNFRMKFNLNVTTNQTEVLSLSPELDAAGGAIDNPWTPTRSRTGHENKLFYMAWDAGVDPERGVNLIWELDQPYFEETGNTRKTGRKIPATKFNLENNRFYHEGKSLNPNLFGGFGSDLTYKNWDFSFQFAFETGRYIYDYEIQRTTDVQRGQAVLRTDLIGNTWQEPGDNAKYPMLAFDGLYPYDWDMTQEVIIDGDTLMGDWIQATGNYNNQTTNWSKYLYRADFIRLRTVQLGYTLPRTITERIKLKRLRVYVMANNLFRIAPYYDNWDPETAGAVVPPLRSYIAGINVTF